MSVRYLCGRTRDGRVKMFTCEVGLKNMQGGKQWKVMNFNIYPERPSVREPLILQKP